MSRRPIFLAWLLLALTPAARSAELRIQSITQEPGGPVRIRHAANSNSYYLLFRGDRLDAIGTTRDAALGVGADGVLEDAGTGSATAFFRVREVPVTSPLDSDTDGIDDVYELRTPPLDPLNAADAGQTAPNSGGRTYLELYREQRAALTTLASTSPFQG